MVGSPIARLGPSACLVAFCGATACKGPATPPAPPLDFSVGAYGKMLAIPGGSFEMGADFGEANERPARRVEVAAFWLDELEVTVRAFELCVSAGRCEAPALGEVCNWHRQGFADDPVNCVSWDKATAFCAGSGKRLPTEAEWEYSARGPTSLPFPWGHTDAQNEVCSMARAFDAKNPRAGTCPPGSKPRDKSPFGVMDLGANVSEWTADACSNDAECKAGDRIAKGGGFYPFPFEKWHAASRAGVRAAAEDVGIGFRCARGGG